MKYRVLVPEVWLQAYEVEADSIDDAVNKLGVDGEIIDGDFEFSHTDETWEHQVIGNAIILV